MTRTLRLLALTPLALALAACGGGDGATTGTELTGEPIAEVPAPEGQQWSQVVTRTEEGGYLMGNPDAPIQLLEFASLTCGACAQFSQQGSTELKQEFVDSGRVSFEYRNYLRGPQDLIAAQIMECGAPERVIPLADQHYARFDEFGQALSDPRLQQISSLPEDQQKAAFAEITGLIEFFAQRGISRDEALSCLADDAKATEMAEQMESWNSNYEITGTPTIYLNGNPTGIGSWDAVKERLEAMGAR
jgi:protein-disulfide isomerase